MKMQMSTVPAAVAILGLLGISGHTLAQGVAGNKQTSHNVLPNVGGFAGWQIGSNALPEPVTLDTAGDPWEQTLRGSNGNPLPTSIQEGRTYAFNQYVLATGADSWSGFEIAFFTAGWEWVTGSGTYADPSVSIDMSNTPGVENIAVPGLTIATVPSSSLQGGRLSLAFNMFNPTVEPNKIFQIKGFIRWVGVNPSAPDNFLGGQIISLAAPLVPSPSGAGLLAVVGLLGLRRRR